MSEVQRAGPAVVHGTMIHSVLKNGLARGRAHTEFLQLVPCSVADSGAAADPSPLTEGTNLTQ